jgi:hypothetical protein
MSGSGQIVRTELLSSAEFSKFRLSNEFIAALRHEKIPFVSYPYEWCFAMLREACLLHLELLKESIPRGVILKDASSYNVQFQGAQAVLIDIGSFTKMVAGEPWSAYRQFCELMLFPLMLQAYRDVDFQPLLRSRLEGIQARHFLQWIGWRDLLKPGVLMHGWMQALLENKTQRFSTSTVNDLRSSGFDSSMIMNLLGQLSRVVERLQWKPRRTQWTEYDSSLPHVAEDADSKSRFVREVCQAKHRQLVWDLGCNDGRYSKIASAFSTTVVAMDQDHACINRLYESLATGPKNIVPLCVELANASPAQGWRGRERRRLEDRGRPDLVLCLGLIHHLVIAANIPLPDVIDWLASLGGEIVLEFPTKNDAMVKALLRNKRDQYSEYSLDQLQKELEKHFYLERRLSLPSGERILFHAIPNRPYSKH